MSTPTYPSWNDKEYDLLKKMTANTALIADYEIGDVASVAGTANQILVNGGTAAATGNVTISLPSTIALTGLTASSAVATDASKNLVSVTNTGTGNNVLATSPTLVTPNIGAATGTSVNLSGAGTFGGNLTVSGSAVSGGYYVGTGNSGAFEGKTSAAGTMVSVGVWNTSTSANSDAGFSLNTQASRSASWVLRRSTGLLEMHDAYQTTGTSRFSIDPLNGNTIVGGNLTVSGTTASTSTTTGALVVSGGVGVAGAIYAGGNLTVSGGKATVGGSASSPSIYGSGTVTVETTAVDLLSTSFNTGAVAIVSGYNASGGQQGVWLIIATGGGLISTVASQNATGLTPTFAISSGKLQMSLASGKMFVVTTLVGVTGL
jgi:hypothetical protein